jgi:tetratricopeptide (TPR) repeat protein
MTRAGYAPAAITRFFERILAEQRQLPDRIPPYLFTHPDVEARIAAITAQAEKLRPGAEAVASEDTQLREVQARLAQLVDARRATLPGPPPPAAAAGDAALAAAERLVEAGQTDAALLGLARFETDQPADPRVSFRVGELLAEQGRHAEAVVAYRRTLRLDPTRALVFFKLGLAYRELGERHRAVYAFEQASLRAGAGNVLQRRSDWEVEKLTFTIVPESGITTAGLPEPPAPASGGEPRIAAGTPRVDWWARLGAHFAPYAGRIHVRWLAPGGRVVQDAEARRVRKPYLTASLELSELDEAPAGVWTVEAHLDDDVIDRQRFRLE